MIIEKLRFAIFAFIFIVDLINNSVSAKTVKKDGLELSYKPTYRGTCYSDDTSRLRLFVSIPISQCVTECSLRNYCELVQYNVRFRLCELFKSSNETVGKSGCVNVKKSDIVITKFPCAEECQNGTACDLASKQCIYKDCLENPLVENGDILGNRKSVRSKIRLKCDSGTYEATQNTAVCQTDGLWSTFPQTCTTPPPPVFQCPESDNTYTDMPLSDGTTFTFRTVQDAQLSHAQALNFCQAEGAHLMTTFPEAKRNVLRLLMRECATRYTRRYWIDGNNRYAQNFDSLTEWVTSTGDPLTTDFWQADEPSDPQNDHCAYLYMENTHYDNLICDWDCDDNYRFICEK